MKKIISVIIFALMAAGMGIVQASTADDRLNEADLSKVIAKYEDEEGFETTTFGSLSMGLIKLIANATASEEDKKALDIFDGIHKFVVIEYGGASSAMREAFNKEVSALFKGVEKIVEVKESGDSVDIYGSLSKDGEEIENIVIHASDECSLVCFFGSVKTKDIGNVVQMTK